MIWNSKDIAITLETTITPTTLADWVHTMDDDDVIEFIIELLCDVDPKHYTKLVEWLQPK